MVESTAEKNAQNDAEEQTVAVVPRTMGDFKRAVVTFDESVQ